MNNNEQYAIHLVADRADAPDSDRAFYDCMCDARTVGLIRDVGYELQIVLYMDPEKIAHIMTDIGERVRCGGLVLHDGDEITEILENEVPIRVREIIDDGDRIMRLVFPDADMNFPQESQSYPFYMQEVGPYKLRGPLN